MGPPPATFEEFVGTNRAVRFFFKGWAVVAVIMVIMVIMVIGMPISGAIYQASRGAHQDLPVTQFLFTALFSRIWAGIAFVFGFLLVWLWWLLFVEKGAA